MFQAYEHREKLLECLAQLEQQALQGTVLAQWPFQCCVLGGERERERESAGPMVIYTLTACQKAFVLLETLVSYSAYLV